jgi:PAS domain S-box-containing protein
MSSLEQTRSQTNPEQVAIGVLSPLHGLLAQASKFSLRWYLALIADTPYAIWITHDEVVIHFNQAMRTLLRASPEENLLGKHSPTFCHPDDIPLVVRQIDRIFKGQVAEMLEIRLRRFDGTYVEVQGWAASFVEDGKRYWHVVYQDITDRKEAERTVKRLQEELVMGLMAAQEEERKQIAYDLHDGLTQYVAAANAHLEATMAAWEMGDKEEAQAEFKKVRHYLNNAGQESRRMVNDLRLLTLEDMGLAGAVDTLLLDEKERSGWEDTIFTHNLSAKRLTELQETLLFRIVQEALTNARKHASARIVKISLLRRAATLSLEIRDDGKGFIVDTPRSSLSHVGLQGMRERVRLLGGTLTIESTPLQGTSIQVQMPICTAHPA